MSRRAFTLIELLIVLTILALLMAITMGFFASGSRLAKRASCANNLRQINAGFAAYAVEMASVSTAQPFPGGHAWPAVPFEIVPNVKLFVCPEEPDVKEIVAPVYSLHTTADDMLIPFAPLEGHCRVVDKGDYIEYRFESGGGVVDYNDVVFHVSKTVPPIATLSPDFWSFRGVGTMSLRRNGKVVVGWEDFRDVGAGEQFVMEGTGQTSYGINAEAENIITGQRRIIVLDYDRTIANGGEDMVESIAAGARHRGRLNVLLGTGEVVLFWPDELHPVECFEIWWP